MKLIIAYIQPEKLNEVKQILYRNDIHKISVMDSFGHSEEPSYLEKWRGVELEIDLLKKIRLEIAVNDEYVDKVIKSVLDGGKSGKIGDGKIFVISLDNCYRIRTGESGPSAIG